MPRKKPRYTVEQILLKERRALIQWVAQRSAIKLRGSSLYVHGQQEAW